MTVSHIKRKDMVDLANRKHLLTIYDGMQSVEINPLSSINEHFKCGFTVSQLTCLKLVCKTMMHAVKAIYRAVYGNTVYQ